MKLNLYMLYNIDIPGVNPKPSYDVLLVRLTNKLGMSRLVQVSMGKPML